MSNKSFTSIEDLLNSPSEQPIIQKVSGLFANLNGAEPKNKVRFTNKRAEVAAENWGLAGVLEQVILSKLETPLDNPTDISDLLRAVTQLRMYYNGVRERVEVNLSTKNLEQLNQKAKEYFDRYLYPAKYLEPYELEPNFINRRSMHNLFYLEATVIMLAQVRGVIKEM